MSDRALHEAALAQVAEAAAAAALGGGQMARDRHIARPAARRMSSYFPSSYRLESVCSGSLVGNDVGCEPPSAYMSQNWAKILRQVPGHIAHRRTG